MTRATQETEGLQALLETWGQQVLQVQSAALALQDQLALTAVMAQTAWLGLLALPGLVETSVQREVRERTERLVRRGIPEHLARQALRGL